MVKVTIISGQLIKMTDLKNLSQLEGITLPNVAEGPYFVQLTSNNKTIGGIPIN